MCRCFWSFPVPLKWTSVEVMADFGVASFSLSEWCLNIRFLVHALEASSRDSFAQTLEVPSADPNTKISSLKAQHVMRLECAPRKTALLFTLKSTGRNSYTCASQPFANVTAREIVCPRVLLFPSPFHSRADIAPSLRLTSVPALMLTILLLFFSYITTSPPASPDAMKTHPSPFKTDITVTACLCVSCNVLNFICSSCSCSSGS